MTKDMTATRANAGPAKASFGMPRVSIPTDLTEGADAEFVFQIFTREGMVNVRDHYRVWVCRGTPQALAAAGLLRLEWCPGQPGTNKVRQTVSFRETLNKS